MEPAGNHREGEGAHEAHRMHGAAQLENALAQAAAGEGGCSPSVVSPPGCLRPSWRASTWTGLGGRARSKRGLGPGASSATRGAGGGAWSGALIPCCYWQRKERVAAPTEAGVHGTGKVVTVLGTKDTLF